MKKVLKTLFIINPIAGTRSKKNIPDLITSTLDHIKFDINIVFTESAGHATVLAREASENNYDLVVAVGGDGTVNEVAKGLVNSETALGILPMGSGNGLARHLQLSMNTKTALTDFSQNQFSKIDTGMINSHLFLCTAGIGLDAKVSHDFAKEKKRGFLTYSIVALKCFAKATSHTWKLAIDGEKIETEGLLLTIANANQYGNNVFIAPKALIQDGLFDVCVLKKFSFQHIPFIVKDIFNKTLHQNRFYTLIKGKEIKIENSRKIEVHYDGEPILLEGEIHIKMYPQSLKVFAN